MRVVGHGGCDVAGPMHRFLPLFLVILGCGRDGVLGQVELEPECAPLDLACQGDGIDRPLAVGAVLPVELASTAPSTSALALELEAVDPAVLKVSANEILGLAPGRSGLLATVDEQVVDLTHVWVFDSTHIAVRRRDQPAGRNVTGPIDLLVDDELELDATAYADGVRLAGRLAGEWSSDSPAIQLLETGDPGTRRLVARSVGRATVTVHWNDHDAQITVEVLP